MKTGGIVGNGSWLPLNRQHRDNGVRAEADAYEMIEIRLLRRWDDDCRTNTRQRRWARLLTRLLLSIRHLAVRTAGV